MKSFLQYIAESELGEGHLDLRSPEHKETLKNDIYSYNFIPDYPQVFKSDNPSYFLIKHTQLENFILFLKKVSRQFKPTSKAKNVRYLTQIISVYDTCVDYVKHEDQYEMQPLLQPIYLMHGFNGKLSFGNPNIETTKSDMYLALNAMIYTGGYTFNFLKGTEYEDLYNTLRTKAHKSTIDSEDFR